MEELVRALDWCELVLGELQLTSRRRILLLAAALVVTSTLPSASTASSCTSTTSTTSATTSAATLSLPVSLRPHGASHGTAVHDRTASGAYLRTAFS